MEPEPTTLFSLHVKHDWLAASALEQIAAAPAVKILERVRRIPGVRGCAALLTCQRSELYVDADPERGTIERVRGFFASGAFRNTVRGAPPSMKPLGGLEVREGAATVRHLFRVSAGLESRLIGEQEIVGQVRQALNHAQQISCLSPGLGRLFQAALQLGRIVRTQPGYGLRRHSYVEEAVRLVDEHLGGIQGKRFAVVGAGQIASRLVRDLQRSGAGSIVVLNRSAKPAQAAIAGSKATYRPLRRLGETLEEADAAVFAISGGRTLLDAATSPPNLRIIVDLCAVPAVTRNGSHPLLLDLEHVTRTLADRHRPDPEVVARVETLAEQSAQVFVHGARPAPHQDALRRLGDFGQALEAKELDKTLRRLQHLSPEDQAIVAQLARSLRAKLLRGPTLQLSQASASAGIAPDALLRLFGVEPDRDGH